MKNIFRDLLVTGLITMLFASCKKAEVKARVDSAEWS